MTPELISPAQAQGLVSVVALGLTGAGALLGIWKRGARGAAWALIGPLFWMLWLAHVAAQERWGNDSLALLIGETATFAALGALLGWVWARSAPTK